MKRFGAWLLLVTLILANPNHVQAANFIGQSYQPRYIVVFDKQIDKKAVEQVGGQVRHSYRTIPACSISVPAEAVRGLEKNPHVRSIEPDVEVLIQGQTTDWGIDVIGVPAAWESGLTGEGTKIAVVDTGIAPHEDLNIAGGVSCTLYTSSYFDDNGHGTHVAGIIGAQDNQLGTVGVAPQASLYSVKVIDAGGAGTLSDLIAGIDWSIINDMDIINLSIGTPDDSPALRQIVDEAYSQGLTLVAAAGNDGTVFGNTDTVKYPANYDSVIAVGAIDKGINRADWSACGSQLEITAPGEAIISTYLNNTYATLSGTSMAAPYVAGIMALLIEAHPDYSNAELRAALDTEVIDLGIAGRDTWYGYGLVQSPVLLTHADFVARFYQLCLLREPGDSELNYWINQLDSGQKTGADLASGFIFSDEFIARDIEDDEYIDILYHTMLARNPDTSGEAYWLDRLAEGKSRLQVLAGFVGSNEFTQLCDDYGITPGSIDLNELDESRADITAFVTRFFQLCLERDPDEAGLAYWVEQLVDGHKTGADIADGFFFSREFQARNLTDTEFLEILYAACLGRQPDHGGLEYWLDKMSSGISRLEVVAGFVKSQEFISLCEVYGIDAGVVNIY